MNLVKKLVRYVFDSGYRFNVNAYLGFYDNVPDEAYLRRKYKAITRKTLDLENPKRFNEKLQWLKLYYRKPVFTTMVDKYAVKDYVAGIIGNEYIVPLLGVYDHFDDIPFNELPEQFVLKTTHGSGGIVVCRDKNTLDYIGTKKRFEKDLKRSYYKSAREWPYKDVKPRIIVEKYMQDGTSLNLNVYKVFNFSGVPTLIQTIQNDKNPNETIDYFDTSWNLLDLRQNFPNSAKPLPRPSTLNLILELSAKCSKGFPFLRTDWYEINGSVYFSEYTFFTDAGFQPFYPDEWDLKLGELIQLPNKNEP